MALALVVGGVARNMRAGTLSIVSTINGTDSLTCELLSMDGSYWPALDDDVYFIDTGLGFFGGEARAAPTSGASGRGSRPVVTVLTALDFSDVLDRRLVTLSLGAVSLESALTSFVALYSGDGMTLDAAQATGPTIDPVSYTRVRGRQILDEWALKYGYLWAEDPAKALRMWAPGDIAAPVDVVEGDICIGDVTVEPTRAKYATKVYVTYFAPAANAYGFLGVDASEFFADGETVTIGSKTYVFEDVMTDVDGHVQTTGDRDDDLDNLAAAVTLDTGAGTAYATATTLNGSVTAVRDAAGRLRATALTDGAAGNDIVSATNAAFAHWFTEGGGPIDRLALGSDRTQTTVTSGSGSWEEEIAAPDYVTTEADAQAFADGYVATHSASPRIVRYRTVTPGLKKGQAQHILVTWRNIDEDCLITSVTLRNPVVESVPSGSRLEYDIEAIEGTAYPGSFHDTYRKWDGAAVAVGA